MGAYSAFLEKGAPPTEEEVRHVLGKAADRWNSIRAAIGESLVEPTEDWTYSGKHHGWAMRIRSGGRAIVYLTPASGEFRASLALGAKAVSIALASDLPKQIGDLIVEARVYAEGRAVRMPISCDDDVRVVLKLVRAKLEG